MVGAHSEIGGGVVQTPIIGIVIIEGKELVLLLNII